MKRILIIDDDATIRMALAMRLKSAGYHVITTASGYNGLVSVLEKKPDLIISDIWMPEGIGLSVAKRLKEIQIENIPIVFMSADRQSYWTWTK